MLADFTSESMIVPRLRGRDTSSVLHELSKALEKEACIPGMLPVYQSALNREYLVSTAMDCGIAFPHARLPAVNRICFATGRSLEPLMWGHVNPQPVHLVFLVAVPATDSVGYLALLSALTKLGKNEVLRRRFLAAEDAAEIYSLLKTVELPIVRSAELLSRTA